MSLLVDLDRCRRMRINLDLYANWWHENYGLTFSEKSLKDTRFRAEQYVTMNRVFRERFGDLVSGQQCSKQSATQLPSVYYFAEALGIKVRYFDNLFPHLEAPNMDDTAMEQFQVPDFKTCVSFQHMCALVGELRTRYGINVEPYTGGLGVLNMAIKLREAERLFLDFYDRPEIVKGFLKKICESIYQWDILCRQVTHTPAEGVYGIAHCSVPLLSLDFFREFLFEHTLKLATMSPTFAIHQDLGLDAIIDEYAKIPNLKYVTGRWDTNWEKLRRMLPNVHMIIYYDMERMNSMASAKAVREDVFNLLREANLPPHQVSLNFSAMDSTVTDEMIRAGYQGARDWEASVRKSQNYQAKEAASIQSGT